MKVHTLDIDSGDRDPILYPDSGDYTVFLKNPVYNVSKIKLISARIHNSQLLIHDRNNTFTMNTATYSETITLPNGNYDGAELASNLVQHSDIIDSATYLTTTNDINISNLTNDFTFAFYGGENGYMSNASNTTPHDVLGLPPNNVHSTSNSLKTGSLNLQGVDAFVLKLSSGSDEFNKSIYFNTPFYTGKILTHGDVVNYSGTDDTLEHEFHSGKQQTISSIRVQFFYSSNGRLIPYDFRNANHVLKFALSCSTDKLENIPKVKIPIDEEEEEKKEKEESDSKVEKYTIHGTENEAEDVDRWNAIISIIFIVLVGFVLLLIPKRKPTT